MLQTEKTINELKTEASRRRLREAANRIINPGLSGAIRQRMQLVAEAQRTFHGKFGMPSRREIETAICRIESEKKRRESTNE